MKNLKEKIQFIYIPFILITICFIPLYTFSHWLLFIKGSLSLKEDILNFWLPLGLMWIPLLIWLQPGTKLLKFKKDSGFFGYLIFAAIAIAIPTIISQNYLITATGKLTHLYSISEIEKSEYTKYYTLNNFFIDKVDIAVRKTATVTGKNNTDYNMQIYIVMPVYDNFSDTAKGECSYWLGKKYSKTIGDHRSQEEKAASFKDFYEESIKQFDSTDFTRFSYLEVLGNTKDHDEFNYAVNKSHLIKYKDPVVFQAEFGPFKDRNGNKLVWIFGSFGIGSMVFFLLLLIPGIKETAVEDAVKKKGINLADLKATFSFFLPRKDFYITPIIMDINILVFLVMVCSGLGLVSFKAIDLLHWGANYKPYTTNGEWWRLLTSIFLHGGIMHLLTNMYGLLFVGILLEPKLGKNKYAIIYLVTGIIASLASIIWHEKTISVGASGAIFGLYGFFLAALLLKIYPREVGKPFLISTLIFVGFNLIMGMSGGIDNAAHIGGLSSGFLLGMLIADGLKPKDTDC
jgi:membrane associated rhomboid family serine protease